MIHYSCDRCQRMIDPESEVRYSVSVEIQAAIEPSEAAPEDDQDHLLELENILSQLSSAERVEISENAYQRRRYDLCFQCRCQFVKNPLATDAVANLEFSDN